MRAMAGTKNQRKWTKQARKHFLERLAETGNVTRACELAGVGRARAYALREEDEAFAAAWAEAEEIAADALELEARRRAMEGVARPVVSAGKLVKDDTGAPLILREYSDRLMEILLRAHRPSKFRETALVEHVGKISFEKLVEASLKTIDGEAEVRVEGKPRANPALRTPGTGRVS